jgi:hypothetical protein
VKDTDITIGESQYRIALGYEGFHLPSMPENPALNFMILDQADNAIRLFASQSHQNNITSIAEIEPSNLIYPYLSKRKAVIYVDQINEQNANSVQGNFTNLYSKIDRLITPQFQPGNRQYIEACKNILGFEVSTMAKGNGKQAVYYLHNLEHISLTAMGEGVSNILGLVTDLCVAEDRIFLIEEPENDIHPKALKALLNLIIEKSATNQFFISTHSNIVMKHLGGVAETKIFNITTEKSDEKRPNLFVSTLTEVSNDPEERRKVLEDLGYDFFDFGLWKGWLMLEESSAEVFIRDWFIKWYVPKLIGKLKTFSAGSLSQIQSKFEDFNRLFVYLHLEPAYKNKAWVIVDSGEKEKDIIDAFKKKYTPSGWNEENFRQFSEHDFESYYPKRFQDQVQVVLEIKDKKEKREAKRVLLDEVKAWIRENEQEAKEEFKISAEPVISILKEIGKKI